MTNTIKLYVANLGKYNEGEHVGAWFDLQETTLEEIRIKIGVAHYDENGEFVPYVEEENGTYVYEEWAIHDYEAPFKIAEYDNIENLIEVAEAMQGLGVHEIEAISELVDNSIADDFQDGIEKLDDVTFYHECGSMEDVAYQSYEQSGQLAELDKVINVNYIDFEAIGRDMDLEGNFYELSDNIYMEYIR